jgi:hypothetical protein
MEINGQLQASADLPRGKGPRYMPDGSETCLDVFQRRRRLYIPYDFRISQWNLQFIWDQFLVTRSDVPWQNIPVLSLVMLIDRLLLSQWSFTKLFFLILVVREDDYHRHHHHNVLDHVWSLHSSEDQVGLPVLWPACVSSPSQVAETNFTIRPLPFVERDISFAFAFATPLYPQKLTLNFVDKWRSISRYSSLAD